jgi:hypothetical protein
MEQLLEAAKIIGVPFVLVLLYAWRDFKREKELYSRIMKMEEYQKTVLADLTKSSMDTIRANGILINTFVSELRTRKCLAEDKKE